MRSDLWIPRSSFIAIIYTARMDCQCERARGMVQDQHQDLTRHDSMIRFCQYFSGQISMQTESLAHLVYVETMSRMQDRQSNNRADISHLIYCADRLVFRYECFFSRGLVAAWSSGSLVGTDVGRDESKIEKEPQTLESRLTRLTICVGRISQSSRKAGDFAAQRVCVLPPSVYVRTGTRTCRS